jgi:2-polyprenyl-3-methyl-5-hydroxy-6-metoxy-1,4-benzoquinol methylase
MVATDNCLVSYLDCIACRKNQLTKTNDLLKCKGCGAEFPVVQGVPRFVRSQNYAGSFGFQWNKYAKTQLDSSTGTTISSDRLFGVSKWPRTMVGQTILEAGSGAGRFTEVLAATGANVISIDLSSAVEANFQNNGQNQNILIAQASILDIPVRPQSMDKVICLGVLQHTPDPVESFKHLARCVRPGGELVIDVYAYRLTALLSWQYALRPLTKRMNQQRLYRIIEHLTPKILPISNLLARLFGRFGSRMLPIKHYPNLGLRPEDAEQWAILDTFDVYSPAHDHPQSLATVRRWFEQAGFVGIEVENGPNGVVGRGKAPDRQQSLADAKTMSL